MNGELPGGNMNAVERDGDVPLYPLPDWVWSDATLMDGARRLRELHAAGRAVARAASPER